MADARRISSINFPRSPSGKDHVVPELGEYIIANKTTLEGATEDEFNKLLTSIKLATKLVNREIRKSGLADDGLGGTGRHSGLSLDEFAKEKFINAMKKREVICGILAPGQVSWTNVNPNAHFVLILSSLEDSTHVSHNVPAGTIFSIYRRVSNSGSFPTAEDFLQPGRKMFCAGYVVYGPCTQLVLSAGSGVQCFTLDPSVGTFFLSHPAVFYPLDPKGDYSVDEGALRSFSPGMQSAIKFLRSEDKSTGRPYACRYIGSLISDFHRNLFHGGVYLCPRRGGDHSQMLCCNPDNYAISKQELSVSSSNSGSKDTFVNIPEEVKNESLSCGSACGHSLLFQCNPIAFLAEQAGGAATDGFNSILHKTPKGVGQTSQLVVGQSEIVHAIAKILRQVDGLHTIDGKPVHCA